MAFFFCSFIYLFGPHFFLGLWRENKQEKKTDKKRADSSNTKLRTKIVYNEVHLCPGEFVECHNVWINERIFTFYNAIIF